jgi:toxoflavin biosynthesis protein ToxD
LIELRRHSVDELVQMVEAPGRSIPVRHAAGLLLGLLGDPRIDGDQPAMIEVPAATVPIGLDPDRISEIAAQWAHVGVEPVWIAKETPRHLVPVDAFRIAKYPVTHGEYLRYVLDVADAKRPSAWAHGVFPFGQDNQPVYSVSPEGADAYARWLAVRTGRAFRLPTENEWEYAATGGDGRQFPWGEAWDSGRANTAETGPLTTTPVGIHIDGASPFGALDMAGNVEEYVSTPYLAYAGAPFVHDDLVDTHGREYRVARGGSYARHGDLVRCSRRHGWYPSDHFAMGFRLAETIRTDPAR